MLPPTTTAFGFSFSLNRRRPPSLTSTPLINKPIPSSTIRCLTHAPTRNHPACLHSIPPNCSPSTTPLTVVPETKAGTCWTDVLLVGRGRVREPAVSKVQAGRAGVSELAQVLGRGVQRQPHPRQALPPPPQSLRVSLQGLHRHRRRVDSAMLPAVQQVVSPEMYARGMGTEEAREMYGEGAIVFCGLRVKL
ncbi:hypothetical protein FH972_012723 [Carpinus fangiana]|uniref:Uncharacterized protein n=1 Tax=Carpinus fangiana TaxID=176857 RepID=A0A5N6R681_9ROSI|nr:hypothetical protein FH972_012723 [Carpinus fangiana]